MVLSTSDVVSVPGTWSPDEESQLLCAIEELAKAGITDMSTRGFWPSVSKALGSTRTPKQCQGKWCVVGSTRMMLYVISTQLRRSDTLQCKTGNEGKARWSSVDRYILICKYVSRACF
jgi:Myb-like DNA-binding domain